MVGAECKREEAGAVSWQLKREGCGGPWHPAAAVAEPGNARGGWSNLQETTKRVGRRNRYLVQPRAKLLS